MFEFISSLVSVFLGAGFAFIFGIWAANREEARRNFEQFCFFDIYLGQLVLSLLKIKQQMLIPKLDAYKRIEKSGLPPHFSLTKDNFNSYDNELALLSNSMNIPETIWPFIGEKIFFLYKLNDCLLDPSFKLKGCLDDFNMWVKDINDRLASLRKDCKDKDKHLIGVYKTAESVEPIIKAIDNAIWISIKIIETNGTFPRNRIRSFSLSLSDKQKKLIPTECKLYEKYKWKPEKKRRFDLFKSKFGFYLL